MVLAAITLAAVTERIDAHVDTSFLSNIPWLYQNQTAGARAVLSAIATSMIGVAGVTFSMTIVTVSFAASNIGPRLISNFMRDTGNQVTLGTFIATFVYCLLILRTVTDASGDSGSAYVPHISLIVALALALLSVSNLIYFIHHIPESINVARIAYLIGSELEESMTRLFPEEVGETRDEKPKARQSLGPDFRAASETVRSSKAGYVQVIDHDTLMGIAIEHDLVTRIEYRPGDFALADSVLLYAHPGERVDSTVAKELSQCFVFGSKRTATQNAMFLVDQLVEIMLRALSPGVNDPFTAVGCMDWLQAALAIIVQRGEPDFSRYDSNGKLRVAVHPVDFERFADAVFSQPLQYVAADRIAALRMMKLIAELIAICDQPKTLQTLIEHAKNLNNAGQQCLPVSSDRNSLEQRFLQTLRMANDPQYRAELRDDQGWLGGRG